MNVCELIKEKLEEETDCPNCSMYCADANMCGFDEMRKQAISIVDEVAQEYNNGWIPCSERLPKCENGCETQALLFQLKETDTIWCGYYGVGGKFRDNYFRPYTNSTDGFDARDVIAWQPLPAPYKEGGTK